MQALKGLESKLKWDIIWVGLIQVANYIFPFINTTYLIRTIGVDLFGRTEFATLVILYFITLTNYEFHISGTRRISVFRNDPLKINQSFNIILTTKAWLFLLSVILYSVLLMVWPERFANWLFTSTFLIVIGHLFYQPHVFMGLSRVRTLAILNLMIKALSTLLIFVFIRSEKDFEWVNLNYSLSHILIGLLSFMLALRLFHLRPQWKSFRIIRKVLKSGFYIFLTNGIIAQMNLNLSAIMLGLYLEPAVLGNYSAAIKIIIAVHVLSLMPLKQVFFPALSYAWKSDRKEFFKKFNSYLFIAVAGNLFVAAFILAFAPWIITVVYGSPYPDMIFVMRMFSFLPMLSALNHVYNDALLSAGKDKRVFGIQLVFALLNLFLLLIVVPKFGLAGVLVTRLSLELCSLSLSIITYYRITSRINLSN